MVPPTRVQTEKRQLQRTAEQLAQLLTLPAQLSFGLQARVLGKAQAFVAVSQQAARWPGFLGIYLRRALYHRLLTNMGDDVAIGMGTILTKSTIRLGNSVYLGSYCIIGDTQIGDNTLISDQVSIISGNHAMDPDQLIKDQPEIYRTIQIGEDCWVGSRAVVMADLGNHCVVGAGSVVTKPVADYAIVVGNPARPIGDRRQKRPERSGRAETIHRPRHRYLSTNHQTDNEGLAA